jgi:hypothetical protein
MAFQRVAGFGGLTIPLSVVITLLVDRTPDLDASIQEVLTYFAENEWRVRLFWLINLAVIPGMALFVSGIASALRSYEARTGEYWSAVSRIGVTSIFIALGVSGAATGVLSVEAESLRSQPEVASALWRLANFMFILAPIGMTTAIGCTAIGLTRASLLPYKRGVAASIIEGWFFVAVALVGITHWGDGPVIVFALLVPGFVGNVVVVTWLASRLIGGTWARDVGSAAGSAAVVPAADKAKPSTA